MKFGKLILGLMMSIFMSALVSAQEPVLFDSMDAGMWGLLVGLDIAFVIVAIALYVYQAFALMAIAKKTKTPMGWLAWIPIANIYLMTQIAGLNGLWTLAILLYLVPWAGAVAFLAIMIWWWWRISEARKFPGWVGILMIIPIVNLVMMGVLAWSDNK
ncbi:MAG: hypothetical protein ABIB43_02310 [archaeon]